MTIPVAYLAKGRLFVNDGASSPRSFDSRFGEAIRDRAVRSAQRHSWKTTGRGAQFMGGAALWGASTPDPARMRIAISGVSRAAQPGLLLYALDTDEVVGLFSLDPRNGEEKRLFHSNHQRVRFPSGRPGRDQVVCSVLGEAGTANIAIMRGDGSDLREVTEGESLDLAPSWIPGQNRVLYQSAGLGRDRDGHLIGHGPFSVQELDLDSGRIITHLDESIGVRCDANLNTPAEHQESAPRFAGRQARRRPPALPAHPAT